MNICLFLCQNEELCGITVHANHVGNNIGSAAGAVCMTRRKTWHTVCLGREQARRSRGRSGRLRAVADARKRLHGSIQARHCRERSGTRSDSALRVCVRNAGAPAEKWRMLSRVPVRPWRMCAKRRCSTATAARNRSGAHFRRGESGQYGRTRRSLTLQPTSFPEGESLLEGLRKRLRMPAA